ncbi:hypothetical protein NKL07_17970 [Mesorhizobium sp. C280B]|uniref:hypothetical protein n=1 Tax=unclassified Mesorhizobium TaxID=325217 RepID=UPI001FDA39FF|nr:hypothetical protein [Mesorhizobium sp. LSJC280B00]
MESDARPAPQKREAPGAEARFSFDRMAVGRFQQAFPRARWSDERRSWFVHGNTAARRIDRWLAKDVALRAPHDDSKGRDAFAFDPISSQYLEIADDLRIRTPYSRTVLEELRAVPWASWDDELRPGEFRSAHMKSSGADGHTSKRLRSLPNRRKGNCDVRPPGTPNPVGPHKSGLLNAGAIATRCQFKIYLPWAAQSQRNSTGLSSSMKFPVNWLSYLGAAAFYPHVMPANGDFVWGRWRSATMAELVSTWPARLPAEPTERFRGWWRPTLAELRVARRNARNVERRRRSRER